MSSTRPWTAPGPPCGPSWAIRAAGRGADCTRSPSRRRPWARAASALSTGTSIGAPIPSPERPARSTTRTTGSRRPTSILTTRPTGRAASATCSTSRMGHPTGWPLRGVAHGTEAARPVGRVVRIEVGRLEPVVRVVDRAGRSGDGIGAPIEVPVDRAEAALAQGRLLEGDRVQSAPRPAARIAQLGPQGGPGAVQGRVDDIEHRLLPLRGRPVVPPRARRIAEESDERLPAGRTAGVLAGEVVAQIVVEESP